MTRTDLLALSDMVLEDLTNKGTLRRARKELAGTTFTVATADDGTVTVDSDDGVQCVLAADRPFADWQCTCLATYKCRHIVRAILHYQELAGAAGGAGAGASPAEAGAGSPAGEATPSDGDSGGNVGGGEPGANAAAGSGGAAPGAAGEAAAGSPAGAAAPSDGGGVGGGTQTDTAEAFDPATMTEEQLAAFLKPAQLRQAARWAARGVLAHVGTMRGITVVRVHHPVPVSVRFLAGANLNYVRCTCQDPDPCAHVALAVTAAGGQLYAASGLRSVPGDQWEPDRQVLDALETLLAELVTVGAESAYRNLRGVWRRHSTQARAAELHHLADLVDELLAELERYDSRHHDFTPSRLVSLASELAARCASLRNPAPTRIPDRLVAGSPAAETRVGKARLIGLGTELVEVDEDCRLVAYLVDARSGAPMRITKQVTDPDGTEASRLANALVAGISMKQWGGGQVMTVGGRMFGHGDFAHTNRSAVGMPAGALDQLAAPFRVESIEELAAHQTRLPPVLDDRAAGADLAACRATSLTSVGFDAVLGAVVAWFTDAQGAPFRLVLRTTPRRAGAVRATVAWLRSWQESFPADAYVCGRWRWRGNNATVNPLLLVGDGVPFQPQVADAVGTALEVAASEQQDELTSPGALLLELDDRLGELLVAGMDRLGRDTRTWHDFAARARRAGSSLVADAVEQFVAGVDQAQGSAAGRTETIGRLARQLLLLTALGHPLA
ncbi:SWIM zinc finger family protein [Buchananella hordeovulneris]|uniref:SWIM zinc finger family protein n=1 Tax=Buchananella hordeovulneris TaxID=52770 RepID=UPI0026DD48EB|nr:SWIM zinc finger family protein [Buchananella hordeovulneris]MDO5080901.1 SWIM zinc finger family protein [Buchananella hordeovulneris]